MTFADLGSVSRRKRNSSTGKNPPITRIEAGISLGLPRCGRDRRTRVDREEVDTRDVRRRLEVVDQIREGRRPAGRRAGTWRAPAQAWRVIGGLPEPAELRLQSELPRLLGRQHLLSLGDIAHLRQHEEDDREQDETPKTMPTDQRVRAGSWRVTPAGDRLLGQVDRAA